jgi:hypothetical protein
MWLRKKDISRGSKATLATLKSDFRSSPNTGLHLSDRSLSKSAKSGSSIIDRPRRRDQSMAMPNTIQLLSPRWAGQSIP